MERFGLVGLPNAGKSSLYNALTNGAALAAPYPFATKDPNIGVAKVLDPRLDALAEMSKTQKTVYATVEVVDIGGLVEGASKGEGLGNKFLANIREVDAIVFVLRAFEDDDIPGPSDPLEHLRIVEIELALADLETVETRLSRAQKTSRMDKSVTEEMEALERAQAHLAEGRPLYRAGITEDDRALLAPQTICKGSGSPTLTRQTCNRSALGCCDSEMVGSTVSTSLVGHTFRNKQAFIEACI